MNKKLIVVDIQKSYMESFEQSFDIEEFFDELIKFFKTI